MQQSRACISCRPICATIDSPHNPHAAQLLQVAAGLISEKPPHEIFADASWDTSDWDEACLGDVVLYMRVAKNVKVPREFKSLIEKYR